jgi:aminoglycoside phosphotransferase (APT) family kinase protein
LARRRAGQFRKPQGYLERQLHRFRGLWEHNRTREVAAVERVATWLAEHLPDSGPATIVHGDYRLGNTIYAPDPPARLLAIFDWEMSTLGDPLADVGYLCALWSEPGDPEDLLLDHVGNATRAAGFLTRAELVERYETASARPVRNLNWYMTFAVWKAIVFMEGNYKRALAGRPTIRTSEGSATEFYDSLSGPKCSRGDNREAEPPPPGRHRRVVGWQPVSPSFLDSLKTRSGA